MKRDTIFLSNDIALCFDLCSLNSANHQSGCEHSFNMPYLDRRYRTRPLLLYVFPRVFEQLMYLTTNVRSTTLINIVEHDCGSNLSSPWVELVLLRCDGAYPKHKLKR